MQMLSARQYVLVFVKMMMEMIVITVMIQGH